MNIIETVDDLVRYVEETDWVTFAELHRAMPSLREKPSVEWAWSSGEKKLGYMWCGGEPGIKIIEQALSEQRLCIAGASVMTYLIDGMTMSNRRGGIDKKWIPVCFRPADKGMTVGSSPFLLDREQAIKHRPRRRRPGTK